MLINCNFDELYSTAADFEALQNYSHILGSDLRQLINEIGLRIRTERENDIKKIDELTERLNNSNRSESLRRIDRAEIEKLRAKSYEPTEEESEVFANALDEYRATVNDLMTSRKKLLDLADEATSKIRDIRRGASQLDPTVIQRYAPGFQRDFEALKGEERG